MDKISIWIENQLPSLASFGIKVLLSILAFYIGTRLIKWLLNFLRRSLGRTGIDTGVVQFICSLARILLYCLLIFNIATQFGVTEGSVAALLGSAGLTIGLGLQGGLSNLAGGVLILIFKPFLVGDYIIDNSTGCEGTVTKIEICYTTLASVDNKNIVIPNGSLSNSSITNVTARDQRRLELKIGISYESDFCRAKEILNQLLEEEPGILSEHETVVFVDELANMAVVVGFRAWVNTDDYWPVRWRMNESIKLAFDAAGIVIAYPQMEIHLRDEKEKKKGCCEWSEQ